MVRNPLQRLGKGWRAPLMGIGWGNRPAFTRGRIASRGSRFSCYFARRAGLFFGAGGVRCWLKGNRASFLPQERKRVIKNESPAPVGQASFGKEEPRRGAAR